MNFLNNFASGYKTHALVIGGLVVILGTFLSGDMDIATAIQRALEVLSISTLRIAVAKK